MVSAWARTIIAIAIATGLLRQSAAQQADEWHPHRSDHYTVFKREGSEADLSFVQRWLEAAEQLMSAKYHVTAAGYHMSVYLLPRPERDIDTVQSGQNQCCSTRADGVRTGAIYFLGPSAPIWRGTTLTSSLGLPKDGTDYHAKVLMSEYI